MSTQQLSDLGVSIWLDDLSRDRIASGDLERLIAERNVVGITTNPTIFANAVSASDAYDAQLRELAATTTDAEGAALRITTDDVRHAADILRSVYERTGGDDGWVSIEVGADSAHDAEATLAEARQLASMIDRPNVFVKIPATDAGLVAIADALAEGISVNVTLIFGLERYEQVLDAYVSGLERARAAGRELSVIHSVASFFVSRVDTAVDARLAEIGDEGAFALRGLAGVANARLAYELFASRFASPRALALLADGARRQRPLWASTGVKSDDLPDTYYVTELVAPGVVNTMPEKTLEAVADHGSFRADAVTGAYAESRSVLTRLAAVGISISEVTAALEAEGVAKFRASGRELVERVREVLAGGAQ